MQSFTYPYFIFYNYASLGNFEPIAEHFRVDGIGRHHDMFWRTCIFTNTKTTMSMGPTTSM